MNEVNGIWREEVKCHPEFGYMRVYVNQITGQLFFNAEDVCRICGVTMEEAERIVPQKEQGKIVGPIIRQGPLN